MKKDMKRSAILFLSVFLFLFGASVSVLSFANAEDDVVVPPAEEVVVDEVTVPSPDSEEVVADTASSTADIVTGDAASLASTTNDLNSTTASSTAASTTVSLDNEAELNNTASTSATTGDNAAHSGGSASVATGDALAEANVINVINTNVINSQGLLAFITALAGHGVDLRNLGLSYLMGEGNASGTCSLMGCSNGSLTVGVNNTATITNTVIVRSSTGGNTATSTDAGADITTGNAYASANVLNLVNTNLINSNYLLVAFNNFGDLLGDITLPGANFFKQLLAGAGIGSTNTSISNSADVTNNSSVGASTGDNSATASSSDASVSTGSAVANANTVNQVNQTGIGGSTLYMLVNVFGDWSGSVQGLPEGMTWATTPTGLALMGGSLGASETTPSSLAGDVNVNAANTATVKNDVEVFALTGSNHAAGASSSVKTGNAVASSNVVNVVNTNIIGQNWMLAIFNIFGNWKGNLTFGRPDLWVGAVAQALGTLNSGEEVVYHLTVRNQGDADAPNAKLKMHFDKTLLDFPSPDATSIAEGVVWNLGTLLKGEVKEFTFVGRTGLVPSGSSVEVPLRAEVMSDVADNNTLDNTENIALIVHSPTRTIGDAPRGANTGSAKMSIVKTASVATATLPARIDYKVEVTNVGDDAYNTKLVDTMVAPGGGTLYSREWELEAVARNETVTLSYTVEYNDKIAAGLYVNTATLTGQEGNSASAYAHDFAPVSASTSVTLLEGAGEVLGDAVDADTIAAMSACSPLITNYITTLGNNNPSSVKLLQYFLSTFENEKALTQSGVYDAKTIAAVKRFQVKYASDILGPWGLPDPSGSVFYTTKKKVNELYCQGRANFPLSATEEKEVNTFRDTFSRFLKSVLALR